jgi:hypothetical protein
LKVENVDLGVERKLVTLIIMHPEASMKLLPILDKTGVRTQYAKFILEWVKEFHDTYGTPPQSAIQDIFEQKKDSLRDQETASSISSFLESLADDYDENTYSNIDFHIKDCEKYIRRVNLEYLREKLDIAIASGDVVKGESLVAGFTQKAIPESQGISLLNDVTQFEEAFDEQHMDSLFEFRGALGAVVGPFRRGEFSAALGTSKIGKSWEIEGVAFAALENSLRVLVLNLEMRDIELRQRYWRCLVNAPFVTGPVSVPFFRPDKELTEGIYDDNVTWRVDHKILNMNGVSFHNKEELMNRMKMRYKGGDIKLMSLTKKETSWDKVYSIVSNLTYFEGWTPDVILLDSLDLMYDPEREYRHRMNSLWSEARDASLSMNCHIHTISQANSEGNEGKEIGLSAIAEDQRKKTHVSQLFSIWASSADQEAGVIRVKSLLSRSKRATFDSAVVLQNLDCGIFCLDSRLASKVEGV